MAMSSLRPKTVWRISRIEGGRCAASPCVCWSASVLHRSLSRRARRGGDSARSSWRSPSDKSLIGCWFGGWRVRLGCRADSDLHDATPIETIRWSKLSCLPTCASSIRPFSAIARETLQPGSAGQAAPCGCRPSRRAGLCRRANRGPWRGGAVARVGYCAGDAAMYRPQSSRCGSVKKEFNADIGRCTQMHAANQEAFIYASGIL